jgi:hypothetical protein
MSGLTLDTGALVTLERHNRRVRALIARAKVSSDSRRSSDGSGPGRLTRAPRAINGRTLSLPHTRHVDIRALEHELYRR